MQPKQIDFTEPLASLEVKPGFFGRIWFDRSVLIEEAIARHRDIAKPMGKAATASGKVRSVGAMPARRQNKAENHSARSIPQQLREMTGYLDSAGTMKILNIKETAFYAQVKSGLIPATRWGSDFRIDPFVLADKLEGVTT